jgi:hypothetical protein
MPAASYYENLKERDHLADLEVDERLILKSLILRMGPIPGHSEKYVEPSCSVNGRKSVD